MEEPPEEALAEPLEPESIAKFPDNNHTDHQEDNWQNLDKEEADNQTDDRTANQADPDIFGQPDQEVPEQIEHRTSDEADPRASNHDNVAEDRGADQVDQRISEQMDSKGSSQTDHVESEQTDGQMPVLHERRTFEYTERRLSSQAGRRAFKQTDGKLSIPYERRASEQINHRLPDQADLRIPQQIDSRLSGLVQQKSLKHVDRRSSDPVGYKISVKSSHEGYDQATEQAENQADNQAESSSHHLAVDKPDYSESDQAGHLIMNKESDGTEENQFDYEEGDHHDDKPFISKKDEDVDFRIQPCKFEASHTDLKNSKVSSESDPESENFPPASNSFDNVYTSNFQENNQGFSPRFPSISTKSDYLISQEKNQVTETKPDISEYRERSSSYIHNKNQRKRFPSIIYQDPYQISLQYMEKHHILQIFQITENLVYERPDDPLSFMLYQVQEMIKNRDKRANYKE